ncbi:MAG: Thioredoxin reductase [Candidatus Moranbacteria bacterium GW2011_GWE1_49_15]|nr:MAG: Thioredoxin reductase [Candidatus Moranbacteria bacterium GW2011_GWE2_47_10]KKW06109.1 MAG: Thioredoxin reductase [Candidatus Moranbacteria bacterium GW2011_GWE1_49_15]
MNKYDLVIVGAGPAGLGASIYASRYKLGHVVLGEEIGGQVTEAWEIENYAGFESISGKELMERFRKQTENLGAKIVPSVVQKVSQKGEGFEIHTNVDNYEAKAVIFALGMKPRKMNIPGEDEFVGKGVSYCATCDAMFFRRKEVVVVGGGDAAATAAIHLSEFASKVTLLYKDELSAEPSWVEEMEKNPKIEIRCCSKVVGIKGTHKVESIIYENSGKIEELAVEGVFIEIGSTPGVMIAKELGVATDEQSYIVVDQTQKTNVENVYAAGDVTTGSNKFRQIITAVAEGAVAAGSVYKKLKLTKK